MIVDLFDENNENNNFDINKIQKYLIDNFIDDLKFKRVDLINEHIKKYVFNVYNKVCNNDDKIITDVINKMFGYDILQIYIDDIDVTDIRVTSYKDIYIKKKGEWIKENVSFKDENEFYEYIRYCVLKNNGNINYDTPIIILSDKKYNLRIEAGILPVNINSPNIVIRVHRHNKNNTLESLFLKDDMLDADMYKFLIKCINDKKNIVLSGKGGSGKTTLLRALIDKLPQNIPITTNEETAELYLTNRNVIQREVISSRDNDKNITLELLTKHSLVMSNDIIIIRRN
ncbi:MAG: ATPase, T2SS/T4P/T4SS family [Clostridia bacterium]